MIGSAGEHQREAKYNYSRRPDVRGKVESVGFQSLAVVLSGNAPQDAGTPPIDAHGEQHHRKSGDRWLDFDAAEEETNHGLVNDPDAGEQQQSGFHESGEILDFAVTVLVLGVGGLIGNADGEECQNGGDQVESGVRGFGQDAQAAGRDSDHNLQPGNYNRSPD